MADTKLSALTELAATPAADDEVYIRDVSEEPVDESKRITIANLEAASTGVHGVGAGTISSVSTANKSIYVDLAASGAADGTSYTDAFTTIQDAVDSLEDVIIHAYTIYVRHGTKKTGTADSDVANKLHDTGEFPAATTWAGRRVFNVDDGTWGVVSARDSDDQLSIVDAAGDPVDLFPDGDEAYVIEPTPYRETVYLNSAPASYPSHVIKGTLTIESEYYWYGACEAQANAGEILDTSADFSNVEVGDSVYVLDLNGANGRGQDYELGTVDDVSQVGSDIVRTTLTKTPAANWKYVIVKTEISGSDDGLDSGTARNSNIYAKVIDNVTCQGFYHTFSDSLVIWVESGRGWTVNYNIIPNCDLGILSKNRSQMIAAYNYVDSAYDFWCEYHSNIDADYCVSAGTTIGLYCQYVSQILFSYGVIDGATIGGKVWYFSTGSVERSTITANCTTGLYARHNAMILTYQSTNSGITPEDPVGTTEGAYIT